MYLLVDEKGRKYLVKGESDVHTNYGVIDAKELSGKKCGEAIFSHTGRRFSVLRPGIIDFLDKAKRGPQAIILKDCSLIAGYTGIRSGSRVVDAGTGSGILAMFLSNIVYPETLISYDIREDFAAIARRNFEKSGIENIKLRMRDIYDGIEEEDLDLITLDLPEPWRVVGHVRESLKPGGYLASYSPSIEQSKKLFNVLDGFQSETLECIVRGWDMKVVRPYSRVIAHTGFITFARWMGLD